MTRNSAGEGLQPSAAPEEPFGPEGRTDRQPRELDVWVGEKSGGK